MKQSVDFAPLSPAEIRIYALEHAVRLHASAGGSTESYASVLAAAQIFAAWIDNGSLPTAVTASINGHALSTRVHD